VIYNIKERDEGLSRIKLGLGSVVKRGGVGGVMIVLNGAEMTIYSVQCSRNLGCLCRGDRGVCHPLFAHRE
jgi:hypothetical protein